jgi:intracellular sulfur oxidation DsrE/DsrF family protein
MLRKNFIAASAVAAATPSLGNVPGGLHAVERRGDFDAAAFAAAVGRPAAIREVFEAVAFHPAVLNNVKNALNGLQFGFGYSPESIVIALAGHGPSSAYAYDDEMWAKYRLGEFLHVADASGAPLRRNAWYARSAGFDPHADPDDPQGMYQDASVQMLQRRGVVVLTCHTAVMEQAKALVAASLAAPGACARDVGADLLSHLVPGSVVVPSMVATIAVLQERYRYAYLTIAL